MSFDFEELGAGIKIAVSEEHTFGTDSFLLSYFATPKRKFTTCDLCTGCGIIPLLWFRAVETSPLKAFAVDIQPKAIQQLNLTIESNSAFNLLPILADLKSLGSLIAAGSCDLVTCNPPYKAVGDGIISERSSSKIARHETMCTIDDVCAASYRLLKSGGKLCVCQLPERLTDTMLAMRANRIEPKRIRFVQQTSHSKPWLVLIEGRKDGGIFLNVNPPLIMIENGKQSQEMDIIYKHFGKVNL